MHQYDAFFTHLLTYSVNQSIHPNIITALNQHAHSLYPHLHPNLFLCVCGGVCFLGGGGDKQELAAGRVLHSVQFNPDRMGFVDIPADVCCWDVLLLAGASLSLCANIFIEAACKVSGLLLWLAAGSGSVPLCVTLLCEARMHDDLLEQQVVVLLPMLSITSLRTFPD